MAAGSRSFHDELVGLFELSQDAFFIAGFDGYLKRANPAFPRSLGYTLDELLAQPFLQNIHPDDRDSVQAALAELSADRPVDGFECRHVCADGSMRWFEWRTSSRAEAGVIYGVARDVTERHRVNAELSALRRIATLVARGTPSSEVFDAVADEIRRCVDAITAWLWRFETSGELTLLAGAAADPALLARWPVGMRMLVEGNTVAPTVQRTRRPARMDDYENATGSIAERVRNAGLRAAVGVPIIVDGGVWGLAIVGSMKPGPLRADTEARMADFADLVATSIANAATRDELLASRARIVAAADDARRRLERDLHDGAQQRLVALGLGLRAAEARVPAELQALKEQISGLVTTAAAVSAEVQEISRGLHPAVLSRGGLGPALKALARRCTVPVDLDLRADQRLPDPVEVGAYYVVAEALTNAAKHARASVVEVRAQATGTNLRLVIQDDGIGGAAAGNGSGLTGLIDRVEALGGRMTIQSQPGSGTALLINIPIET